MGLLVAIFFDAEAGNFRVFSVKVAGDKESDMTRAKRSLQRQINIAKRAGKEMGTQAIWFHIPLTESEGITLDWIFSLHERLGIDVLSLVNSAAGYSFAVGMNCQSHADPSDAATDVGEKGHRKQDDDE